MIGKLLCAIRRHKYVLYRKINSDITEVICARCKCKFGMHHQLKVLLPLDEELRKEHDRLVLIEYFKGN